MKLTDKAIELLSKKESKALRTVLALKLNFTERWILICIQENKENGPLTTVAAIRVLQQESGLSEKQLLKETEKATA